VRSYDVRWSTSLILVNAADTGRKHRVFAACRLSTRYDFVQ
jgi:hypothetical protein